MSLDSLLPILIPWSLLRVAGDHLMMGDTLAECEASSSLVCPAPAVPRQICQPGQSAGTAGAGEPGPIRGQNYLVSTNQKSALSCFDQSEVSITYVDQSELSITLATVNFCLGRGSVFCMSVCSPSVTV